MKIEKRRPQEDDQDKIDRAVELIYELMSFNQSIEPTLWAGAIMSVLVMGYRNSGLSYRQFRAEMTDAFENYEEWWHE